MFLSTISQGVLMPKGPNYPWVTTLGCLNLDGVLDLRITTGSK